MTEAEALKQFIPILGRISPPGERATITRNILERIAGNQTCIMGVSHKQAGALAWPGDPVKASEYENSLNAAVDAGDFVSLLHRADRRHFQIEELTSWPDCPAISPDSPLTFWLGEPAPAQTAATPAPVTGGKKWTPEKLAELKTYRETHTMPETAVKFGISEQRIRDLLPSKKPKAKPFAGLIHRMK